MWHLWHLVILSGFAFDRLQCSPVTDLFHLPSMTPWPCWCCTHCSVLSHIIIAHFIDQINPISFSHHIILPQYVSNAHVYPCPCLRLPWQRSRCWPEPPEISARSHLLILLSARIVTLRDALPRAFRRLCTCRICGSFLNRRWSDLKWLELQKGHAMKWSEMKQKVKAMAICSCRGRACSPAFIFGGPRWLSKLVLPCCIQLLSICFAFAICIRCSPRCSRLEKPPFPVPQPL